MEKEARKKTRGKCRWSSFRQKGFEFEMSITSPQRWLDLELGPNGPILEHLWSGSAETKVKVTTPRFLPVILSYSVEI